MTAPKTDEDVLSELYAETGLLVTAEPDELVEVAMRTDTGFSTLDVKLKLLFRPDQARAFGRKLLAVADAAEGKVDA